MMHSFGSRVLLNFFLLFFLFSSGYGQFTDDFSDGDFTNNPAWSGVDSNFTVVNGQLRSNAITTNYNFYLSTASSLAVDVQWEFWVNLQFNTSSANYVDVFLISDAADLKSNLNGYFVRLGNTSDEISLYRKNGAAITKIIDGVDNILNASNSVLKIRVTRTAASLWTLERDLSGTGTSFFTEGTVTDATFTTTNYFGIFIQQSTASFFQKHFFDDFYVGAIAGDTVAPVLNTVNVISNTQLDLNFSEPVNKISSENISNYTVNNGIGNPSSAIRDATDSSIVHLDFSSAFNNGTSYTITASTVTDNAGNPMITTNKTFVYFVPVPAVYGDVIISEIFPDPSPQIGLPNAEFVEIYNRSNKVFDLNGWKFSDGTSTGTIGSYILPASGYLILTANSTLGSFTPYGPAVGLTTWPSLNNSGDNLSLKDNTGILVDAVSYSDTWYQDAVKKDGGWTLEIINPNHPCSGANNWIASKDSSGGTPGKQNSVLDTTPDTQAPVLLFAQVYTDSTIGLFFNESMDSVSLLSASYVVSNGQNVISIKADPADLTTVTLTLSNPIDTAVFYTVTVSGAADCSGNLIGSSNNTQFVIGYRPEPGDIIINEIMADPTPIVGLPDAEYVELHNKSSKLLDLSGCNISGATFAGPTLLYPNDYIILTSATNASLFTAFGNTAAMNSWSSTFLTNGGKELILKNSFGQQLDKVYYDISWYKNTSKDDGGWSLELINPKHPCSGADNWIASDDVKGGTPGKQNSVYDTLPDIKGPDIIGVVVNNNTQIEVTFSESMDSASVAGAAITIDNGIIVFWVSPTGPDFMKAIIDITPALDSTKAYTITINGAKDCSGNLISSNTFIFGIGIPAQKFEVVINELFPDPDSTITSLPEVEFVELYNNTNKVLNLSGYKISDLSSKSTITGTIILPNDYLILCPKNNISDYKQYGKAIGLSSLPSLNNSGDKISLLAPDETIIHSVNYTSSWYGDDNKKNGGWTLEMIDPSNPCGEASNWRASNDAKGGTPGQINSVFGPNPDDGSPVLTSAYATDSVTVVLIFDEAIDSIAAANANYSINNGVIVFSIVVTSNNTVTITTSSPLQFNITYTVSVNGVSDCIGNTAANNNAQFALPEPAGVSDLIINEVLFNPRTGGSDFVEVYNNSNKIISLKNWKLANTDSKTGEVSSIKIITGQPFTVFPQEYRVFTKDTANIKKEYPLSVEKTFFYMSSLPSYNNDVGAVILLNDKDEEVDRFSYTEKMHFPLLQSVKGVSLERIDFNRPTQDETNWHSASEAVGFATPGYKNSQFRETSPSSDNISIEPEIFSPDNDGNNDVVNIKYKFDSPGLVANITIYDANGRVIRNLVQNQLLGAEGVFSWDGFSDERQKARIGIYIIFFEAFGLKGELLRYKKTCVLAHKLN